MLGSKGNITQDASEPVTHLENRNPPNVCLMKMAGAALGSSRWILPAVAQSANSALLPLCHCFPTAAGVDQRAIHYPKIYKGVFALKDYVLLKNKVWIFLKQITLLHFFLVVTVLFLFRVCNKCISEPVLNDRVNHCSKPPPASNCKTLCIVTQRHSLA